MYKLICQTVLRRGFFALKFPAHVDFHKTFAVVLVLGP